MRFDEFRFVWWMFHVLWSFITTLLLVSLDELQKGDRQARRVSSTTTNTTTTTTAMGAPSPPTNERMTFRMDGCDSTPLSSSSSLSPTEAPPPIDLTALLSFSSLFDSPFASSQEPMSDNYNGNSPTGETPQNDDNIVANANEQVTCCLFLLKWINKLTTTTTTTTTATTLLQGFVWKYEHPHVSRSQTTKESHQRNIIEIEQWRTHPMQVSWGTTNLTSLPTANLKTCQTILSKKYLCTLEANTEAINFDEMTFRLSPEEGRRIVVCLLCGFENNTKDFHRHRKPKDDDNNNNKNNNNKNKKKRRLSGLPDVYCDLQEVRINHNNVVSK